MKRYRFLFVLFALLLIVPLAACSPDSRIASSGKLISGYFKAGEQADNGVSVLSVLSWQDGYLALARYTGSGDHLLLFRIQKDSAGSERITAVCEGGVAGAAGYSVNIVPDSGKTIIFGDFANASYKSAEFAFDDNSKASANVGGAAGYIVAADGEPKLKDFTLKGAGNTPDGTYKAYTEAGGGVTRTSFTAVK